MFSGRANELNELERCWRADTFQFPVLYGRRRVGKTALLREFVRNKRALFITGTEASAGENLQFISQAIYDFSGGVGEAPTYAHYRAALEAIFAGAKNEPMVCIIDEYPYLAKAYPAISSILQALIDQFKDTTNLTLILCGSSMSFMEKQVLGRKSPLYGRRTAQIKLRPFTFAETCAYIGARRKVTPENLARYYALSGGVPYYLEQIDFAASWHSNVCNVILNPSSVLFEEPATLLKQELRDPRTYNAVIYAIATGSTRQSEIADRAGISTASASSALANLITLGIVCKETPVGGGPASKRALYRISDSMFRFWYRFVLPNTSALQAGMIEQTAKRVEREMPTFMGEVFEKICEEHIWTLTRNGELGSEIYELGRWWGTDAQSRKDAEIDLVGVADKNSALFAECKWTQKQVGADVLELLVARSNSFNYRQKEFIVFAKTGGANSLARAIKQLDAPAQLIMYRDILDYQLA